MFSETSLGDITNKCFLRQVSVKEEKMVSETSPGDITRKVSETSLSSVRKKCF